MIQDKYESIRKALEISKEVYDTVKARLRPGVSERQVYDMVSEVIAPYQAQGHEMEFIGDFVSGVRTGDIGGDPTERQIAQGELFILDLSLKYDGGWCDTCRTFFLGAPTEEMRRAYRTILGCMAVGEGIVRGGVRAAALHLIASIPNANLLEYDVWDTPIRHEIVPEDIPAVNGYAEVPNGPGLGIEVDDKAIEKYRCDRY